MIKFDNLTEGYKGSGYSVHEIANDHHPQLKYLKQGALVGFFDGVDTILDFVQVKMPKTGKGDSSAERGGGNFHAFKTYREAVDTFRNKPETVSKFDPAELRIKDVSESGTSVDYDVVGDYIDMGRYMEGIPESVGTMHNGNARNRRANILINLSQVSGMSHQDIAHRGERILRLVDALEAGGVRCQLVGAESSECTHIEVTLKHHDEPLTTTDLAVVVHPEFLRRILFRIIEHSKTFTWGYGHAFVFGQALTPKNISNELNDELDIVIDGSIKGKDNIDRLFDQIERLLVWEMSKPIPEVSAIRLDPSGIYFEPNGARDEAEIQREGKEVMLDD